MQILTLLEEIRPHLLNAGFQRPATVISKKKLDAASPSEIQALKAWMENFQKHFILPVQAIWAKQRPEIWEMYRITGVKGNWEQVQLEKAQKALRLRWTQRPSLLRKDSNDPRGTSRKNRKRR